MDNKVTNQVGTTYYQYWAKASDQQCRYPIYHLLPYHSLDVAAVGQTLLEQDHLLMNRFQRCLGLQGDVVKALVRFLLAIHDIGKFSVRFQNLRSDILAISQPSRICKQKYTVKHDDMGYWLWESAVLPQLHANRLVPLDCEDLMDWKDLLAPLAKAVTGHHGRPPKSESSISDCFDCVDKAAAIFFVTTLAELFFDGNVPLIPSEPFEVRETSHKRFSWALAGLCILSDWLGSNSRHFLPYSNEMRLEHYWNAIAMPKAFEAVTNSGILLPQPATAKGFRKLFPHLSQNTPTPLQQYAEIATLPGDSQLHIFEDATGSGKTEAALLCAHRLMQTGLAEGIFVALPTMATANAMYDRMADVYHNLFVEGSRPYLTLSHGARHLSRKFLESIELENIPQRNLPEEASAEAICSAWLADNRKKAMLAATGVGTIDQALLGVLASKHQSLRLFGLARSVLIVDEVHSYDPYMRGLLCELLTFQAAHGGSAILLSATLPYSIRQELVQAFAKGVGCPAPQLDSAAYPLATAFSKEEILETAINFRGETQHIPVSLIHNTNKIEKEIAQVVAKDGCILWIRNTVDDALNSRSILVEKKIIPAEDISIFHARFTACDRLKIEEKIISAFGPQGNSHDRKGKVVIATQVAEQSLDIDFDVLITDLAPIDLILQRIGRWRRHRRSDRPEGLPDCVYVYSPPLEKTPDAHWYSSLFSRAAYVYPFHSQLWLTAKVLAKKGAYRMPDDARHLIESVYGEERERVPEALRRADTKAHGEAMAMMTMAGINSLKISHGYGEEFLGWRDEEISPTRLGEPTMRLRLAKWGGQKLSPWSNNPARGMAWSLSEVSIPLWRVAGGFTTDDPDLIKALEEAKEEMPDRCQWSLLIPMIPNSEGDWISEIKGENGRITRLKYGDEYGLVYES